MQHQLKLFKLELLFDTDVVERAYALFARYGSHASTMAGIRSSDDIFNLDEVTWWKQIALACRYLNDGLCSPL
jgi:hypothetical protein